MVSLPGDRLWRSLRRTPKGAQKQRSPLVLGVPSCTCRALTPGSKREEAQVLLEQHAPLPAAHSPTLSHTCSECQQDCLNKQVAYFTINMQKASFNVQRLKQQPLYSPPPLSQTSYWSQERAFIFFQFLLIPFAKHWFSFPYYQQSLKLIISILFCHLSSILAGQDNRTSRNVQGDESQCGGAESGSLGSVSRSRHGVFLVRGWTFLTRWLPGRWFTVIPAPLQCGRSQSQHSRVRIPVCRWF